MADDTPRQVDVDRAGDPYWVEFVGGPYDGQMRQLPRTRAKLADGSELIARGVIVPGSAERLPDGTVRRGGGQGHYVEDGWADEELAVVRMTWSHDPADEVFT